MSFIFSHESDLILNDKKNTHRFCWNAENLYQMTSPNDINSNAGVWRCATASLKSISRTILAFECLETVYISVPVPHTKPQKAWDLVHGFVFGEFDEPRSTFTIRPNISSWVPLNKRKSCMFETTITSDGSTWSSVDPQCQRYMEARHGQFTVLNLKRPYGLQIEQSVREKWPICPRGVVQPAERNRSPPPRPVERAAADEPQPAK